MQSSHRADIPRADAVGQQTPGDGVASGYLAVAACLPPDKGCISQAWQHASKNSLAYCSTQDLSAHKRLKKKPQALMFYFPKLEKGRSFMFSSASSTPNSYKPAFQDTHPSPALIACAFGVLHEGLSRLQNLLGRLFHLHFTSAFHLVGARYTTTRTWQGYSKRCSLQAYGWVL